MAKHRIAWLPGDGTGPEVLEAARSVLDASGLEAEYLPGDIGWNMWLKEGNTLPERTVELLKRSDCAFFGARAAKARTYPVALPGLTPISKASLSFRLMYTGKNVIVSG
jgi:isocitrate/isopropylmalate dehydrogenase